MARIYRFEVQVIETIPSHESFPALDEYGAVIGAFARLHGDQVRGWLAGADTPVALKVTTGDGFWFTPRIANDGLVSHAVVSERKLGPMSVRVTAAEEENIPTDSSDPFEVR
jgi:hypothetical protein